MTSTNKRQYTMSKDALKQRKTYGFKKDLRFTGEWTMVRMRKDIKDKLKNKFGSLSKAFEFAILAK